MDQNLLSAHGIDAFVQVQCSSNPPGKTSVVTEQGASLNPYIEEEVWMPVMIPNMDNAILLSVWDEDVLTDDLVSYITDFKFDRVKMQGPKGLPPRWCNLYGAPLDVEGTLTNHEAFRMNRYPKLASTYRGRVLVALRVEDEKSYGKREQQVRGTLTALCGKREQQVSLGLSNSSLTAL